MTYIAKPLSCDPTRLKGLSEKLIVSHWENNYGGTVRRLNAITAQLTEIDFATAPIFVVNGLKGGCRARYQMSGELTWTASSTMFVAMSTTS